MEWSREKTLSLIEAFKRRPGLWDMTHDDYRKKEVKQKLLMEVSASMGANVPIQEIEKKFHTLRTQYHREINRMKRKEPYNSKWFGFKTLEFLSSPKACRSSKTRSKADLKDDTTLTTNYIIREAIPQHDNSGGGANESNNMSEQYITLQRNSTSRSHELEKLIEETTKDVEDIDDSKSKLTIKEITVPLHHNHSYHTPSTGGSEISSGEHDHMQQQEIHHQHHHHQVEESVIEMHEGGEITYQTANSTGGSATSLQHHHHHQSMPTRIIKIQRRDTCPEESYYDEGHQQQPNIHNAVSAGGGKRIYYEANGQQHTATIVATPSPNSGNASGTVLLNSSNKLHSQIPSRNSLTITQVHPQSPQNSSTVMNSSPQQLRDDYTIYGEYVANEMRTITNREILIALKHKINTALFEANMAEIQK